VGTVNYPNDYSFTRITEFKHLTGQVHPQTSIVREYPEDGGDPYYPVPRPENQELYQRYNALAALERDVFFVGRLAEYRYYNMDQVVARSLMISEKIVSSSGVLLDADRKPSLMPVPSGQAL
jgi:UDP-galactopyranose mutase